MQVISYIAADDAVLPKGAKAVTIPADVTSITGRAQLNVEHLLQDFADTDMRSANEKVSAAAARVTQAQAELDAAVAAQKTVVDDELAEAKATADASAKVAALPGATAAQKAQAESDKMAYDELAKATSVPA